MSLWSHQTRCLEEVRDARESGERRILCTAPTGGGKSRIMQELILGRERTVLYTHRRFLREQIERGMTEAGIEFGVRASGKAPALLRDVQISSIQTEDARVFKRGRWELHGASLVLIDEAHVQGNGVAEKIINAHIEAGATVIGFTATPMGLGHVYDRLIIAGTNSELRECGAHVLCQTYGPDEPDLRKIGPVKVGEDLTESQNRQAMMRPGIFGRVYDWWQRLNQDARPAILFAPGVPESMYFAEEFHKKGVPAAHIDGEYVWINGERMPSDQEARDALARASESGEVKVVCNRFVMREGIDWPWLYHCIMATVFGSPTSYLQSGGRLLRAHPSLDHVLLQDHGGNWWRHGSLNADREWALEYTEHMVAGIRAERMREKQEAEPIVCAQCGKVRSSGPVCSACGFRCERRSRKVVQHDGTLKEFEGDIFKPRRVKNLPNTEKIWIQCVMRAKNSKQGMTFNQAVGLFFYENHYYPPKGLPMMPTNETDWFRKVNKVTPDRLVPKRPDPQKSFA